MELIDARGCLTPAGVRAVATAPAGQAPAHLAAHVGTCAGCQRRVLGLDERAAAGSPRRPSPARTAFVLAALLLMGLLLLWSARLLLV